MRCSTSMVTIFSLPEKQKKKEVYRSVSSLFTVFTLPEEQKNDEEKETEETGKISNVKRAFNYDVVCFMRRRQESSEIEWIILEKGFKATFTFLSEISQNFFSDHRIYVVMHNMQGYIKETPCYKSLRLLADRGFNIYLKKELFQYMNSIKTRGVIYTLLNLPPLYKYRGVVTISRGKLASILCHYAYKLKISMIVVIPQSMKYERNKLLYQYQDLPIDVIAYGRNMLEVHNFAVFLAILYGLFYLDLNDHPNMIIGQATMGLEMMQQVNNNIDAVILPTTIDGCNLTMCIALAIKTRNPNVQVIKVQVVDVDSWIKEVRDRTTLCNELNFKSVTEYKACALKNLPNCLIDEVITINQTMIANAFEYLTDSEGLHDYHAAIALAPILTGQLDKLKGKRVVIPLYGVTDSIDLYESNIFSKRPGYNLRRLKGISFLDELTTKINYKEHY